ncbi:ATP-dependent Clp protease proteolytic subunit [Hydrogenimonas sp.]|nr:ATP-dependent Clp protease proteolytic subunit [Hydrogenimonas sp.]
MAFIPTIVDTEGKREYATDLFSRLLKDRIVLVHQPIDSNLASTVVSQLLYLDKMSDEPIYIYISSPGGEVMAGFEIIDIMNLVKSPVHTVAMGMVASMASILLCNGEKRYILPNAQVMLHQPLGGVQGQASDIEITAKQILKIKSKLNEILSAKTGKSIKTIENVTDRDSYFDAREALDFGLVDEILDGRDHSCASA